MNLLKYVKSLVYEDEKAEYKWIGGLIFFMDDGKMVLDRGFVITGDVDEYAFYTNFRNFTLINNDLHYMYPDSIKKINKIYLHLKYGTSPYPVPLNNPTYWNLFFSSPNNKIYKSMSLDEKRIKIMENNTENATYNTTHNAKSKIKSVNDIICPLFDKRQIYNPTCVLFSEVNCDIF